MISTVLGIVFTLIVLGVIWWAIQQLLPLIPLPHPFGVIIKVILTVLLVIVVLWVIAQLLGLGGVPVRGFW